MTDSDQQMDVYSGVRWSAVATYAVQALEVVVSIVVARIVAPEAYGLLGMAIVITGFLAFQIIRWTQSISICIRKPAAL